jgi:ABC-type polysaccharide/polyol phosphate transport system ATPase subunit
VTDSILIEGLGKRYVKYVDQPTLLGSLLPFRRSRPSPLWALRGLDLRVEKGQTIGVIGRNGSGKTTLLKLLSGVTRPSEGRLRVMGRIAPLIGVGVGFRRELTGRDNVYLNGLLLGMERRRLEERFDDIVAFAELPDFIDTPVKFYSSGMFLRLGFAIAIHTDPEVFLLDEILAVGDLAFQTKCFERLRMIQNSGTTIVVVSHSMNAIRGMCSRVVLLRRGLVDMVGETEEVIARYHELLSVEGDADEETARAGGELRYVGGVVIEESQLFGPNGPAHYSDGAEQLELRVGLRFERPVDSPLVGMQIFNEEGVLAYACHSLLGLRHRRYDAGETAKVSIRFVPRLGGGTYRVFCFVATADGRGSLAVQPRGVSLFVASRPGSRGVADLQGSIEVDGRVMGPSDDERLTLEDSPRSTTA